MAIPQRVWTDKKVVRAKGDDKLRSQVYLKDGELQYQDAKGHWIVAGGDLPPLNNAIEATSEHSADIFTMDDENLIRVSIETEAETGDQYIEVSPLGIFANERYTIDDYNGRWNLFTGFDTEKMRYVIENLGEFPSDLFALFNAYYQNPTEANEQAAYDAIMNWIPEPEEPLG